MSSRTHSGTSFAVFFGAVGRQPPPANPFSKPLILGLSVPKIAIGRKIAAFSNRKVPNRRFCRRNRRKIARKSQKKSQPENR